MKGKPIAIIVHGGTKEIPPEEQGAHREGCERAAEAGYAVLDVGGTCLQAVEAAIRVMEDDPTFNAGYGSDLNADGEVQMDAALMDGETLKAGAVAFVQTLRHPISIARKVFDSEEVLIVGDGAERFAREHGAELCANEDLITKKSRKKWEEQKSKGGKAAKANNTVGCVAVDADGKLAAGASTGGTGMNRRGRVGDSPQIGSGIYADNQIGGCSMTGDGDSIARVVLAKFAVDSLSLARSPDDAAKRAMDRLAQRTEGDGGCILIDKSGRVGWGHNSANMAVAYRNHEMDRARGYVHKCEE